MPADPTSLREIFSGKYEDAESDWVGNSGPGSDPYYNLPYRAFLEGFLRLNHIGSVVDIGCGDWQFSRFVDFGQATYLGLDVVASVVDRNEARFGGGRVRFAMMPDDHDALPPADLLIIKDVLQHLPNDDILAFRDRVLPRYRFCLLTNSYRKLDVPVNVDIPLGAFRCLDLRAPPFDFEGAYVLQFATAVWEELRTLLYVPPR